MAGSSVRRESEVLKSSPEEPARHEELRLKVEAILKASRAKVAEAVAEAAAKAGIGSQAAVLEDVLASSTMPKSGDGDDALPSVSLKSSGADVNASESSLAAAEFAWTNFRDKRLGHLVADFRYNFQKAAEALGEEFSCSVSSAECRQRYGELVRPRSQVADAKQDGRAIDGPPSDPQVLKEVADWWLRRVAKAPTDRPRVAAISPSSKMGLNAANADQLDLSEEMRSARFLPRKLDDGEAPDCERQSAQSLQSLFAPPPRAEKHEIRPVAAKSNASELLDLD